MFAIYCTKLLLFSKILLSLNKTPYSVLILYKFLLSIENPVICCSYPNYNGLYSRLRISRAIHRLAYTPLKLGAFFTTRGPAVPCQLLICSHSER